MINNKNIDFNQGKKVTCIIPSYKRCDTVIRAVDSVLNQTYGNIEVCIVDDNVPGDHYSLELQKILSKYEQDNRVKYIQQKQHINGAVARNVGIKCATGEYIAFLDDDDEWCSNKIEEQMKIFNNHSDIDAVTTLWMQLKNGEIIRKCHPYSTEDFQFKVLSRQIAVFTSTLVIKKEAISRFGGFDEKLLRHQDLQFLVDASNKSKFAVVPQYLVKLHIDSEINKPNIEKLIAAKHNFFNSVEHQLLKYNTSEIKRIKNAHYYEVVFQALKNKKFCIAIKCLVKAGISFKSLKDLYNRYFSRNFGK